ncbi:hypothetical protein D3C77_619630 [compost metagenome]
MDHPVTVGAQRHKVSLGIYGFLLPKFRNRYYMVNVNEAFRVYAVNLFEIKPTCLAVKPVDSDGLRPQIFPALVARSKVACLAALIG